MKKLLLFFLILSSSLWAQYLNHDYNLGRIVGGGYRFNTLVAELDRHAYQLAPALRFRMGVADRYQWDLDMSAHWIHANERLDYGAGFVFLGGNYKINNGHVLDWSLQNNNVAVTGTDHSIISGFDSKYRRTVQLSFTDRYLSREGYIFLDSAQYGFAFLHGPLLNPGQYQHQLQAHFTEDDINDPSFQVHYEPSLGLLPPLELQALMDLSHATHWNNQLGFGAEFRLSWLRLKASTQNPTIQAWDDLPDPDQFTHTGAIGILLGHRPLQFAHVEGNYDRFFSPILGARQIYLTHQTEDAPFQDSKRLQTYTSGAQVGINDFFTLGFTHRLATHGTDHSLTFSGIYSNIPLRTEGPYDVADMEYLWGYLVKPGDWRLCAQWRTPFLDPEHVSNSYGSSLTEIPHTSPTALSSYPTHAYSYSRPDIDVSVLLGLSELIYGKFHYSFFEKGLRVYGDTEELFWTGRTHVAGLAAGYTRFNAIWEAGVEMQSGSTEVNGNVRNVFPVYVRGVSRF